MNRQALYLRPDTTRVIVRPLNPATEPRDHNPTDKVRANNIVERVLALDGFDDDPKSSNEPKLEAIQMAWYEEFKES